MNINEELNDVIEHMSTDSLKEIYNELKEKLDRANINREKIKVKDIAKHSQITDQEFKGKIFNELMDRK